MQLYAVIILGAVASLVLWVPLSAAADGDLMAEMAAGTFAGTAGGLLTLYGLSRLKR